MSEVLAKAAESSEKIAGIMFNSLKVIEYGATIINVTFPDETKKTSAPNKTKKDLVQMTVRTDRNMTNEEDKIETYSLDAAGFKIPTLRKFIKTANRLEIPAKITVQMAEGDWDLPVQILIPPRTPVYQEPGAIEHFHPFTTAQKKAYAKTGKLPKAILLQIAQWKKTHKN